MGKKDSANKSPAKIINIKEISENIEKRVRPILRELNASSKEIEASSVMTRDGLSVGSVMEESVDPDRLGAMCASMLSLADKTAKELARGNLKQLLIDGTEGYLLLIHVGTSAVLAVVARPNVNLGKVLLDARKTATKIHDVFVNNDLDKFLDDL
ncbi:MAG: hypothetical protein GXP19_08480 [Gammaproteobacteria bacterium]|nr:hypothetical protein [Gammaproteobacteria bacterium]